MNKNLLRFLWALIFWWKLKILPGNPLNIRYHFQFIEVTPVQCLIFSHIDACPENLVLFLLMMLNFSGMRSVPSPAANSNPRRKQQFQDHFSSFFFFLLLVKEPSWYHTFVGVPYATVFCVKSAASFKFLKSPIAFCSPSLPVQMVCSRCSSELFRSQWRRIKNRAIFNTHRHMRARTHMYISLCIYSLNWLWSYALLISSTRFPWLFFWLHTCVSLEPNRLI